LTLSIHLTTDWPFERVARYGKDITAAIKKLVERYPDELTLAGLAEDMISGKNQLWLILEGDEFRAFVTSEIKVNEETGRRTLLLSELAGEGGIDLVPMIGPIEDWARENDIQEITPLGREGWRKPLARAGYKPKFVLYSKDLTNG
jgi:hypothetical protein